MEKFASVNCVVLLLLTIFGLIACFNDYDLDEFNETHNKKFSSFTPWMVFRLRQRRVPSDNGRIKFTNLNRQQILWLLERSNLGKRYPARINRNSNGNEMSFTNERWLDINLASRSPPFAPRLGRRNSSPFIPRLGRDKDALSFI